MSDHTLDASNWHERPSIETEDLGAQLSEAFSLPSPNALLFAFGLVAAELARLLEVYVQGHDSMDTVVEVEQALDSFRLLRSGVIAEAVQPS